jgi:hypothetical protein
MEELATYTDIEIVDELKKRFPLGLIVAGVKETEGKSEDRHPDKQTYFMDFQCLTASIGLCDRTKALLIQSATDCTHEVPDEEVEEDDEE